MKFDYLPKKYRTVHSACFKLVQQIEEFIVGNDYRCLQSTTYKLSDEEIRLFDEYDNIWDYLQKYKKEQFCTLLNKNLILGLLKDFCYFILESLECSKKMRLVVSFALLRRPLVDNLKILLRIFGDASFHANFVEKDNYDPTKIDDKELKQLLDATDSIRFANTITGQFIYECVFDKNNPNSLVNLSNRAIHPVTTRPWNKTGAMNCNFMFVTADDIEELWKLYYSFLPPILIFYSELFNVAVFCLFKDEVDESLYIKRLERLAEIMKGFVSNTFKKASEG